MPTANDLVEKVLEASLHVIIGGKTSTLSRQLVEQVVRDIQRAVERG